MSTFLVLAVLVIIVSIVVMKMIKDKRSGKSCCSGDCNHCGEGCRH